MSLYECHKIISIYIKSNFHNMNGIFLAIAFTLNLTETKIVSIEIKKTILLSSIKSISLNKK